MRKLFIILGFISALCAVVLAVTSLYHLAVTPIVIAFASGLIILFLSKKENTKTKTIQYIFLLVIMALSLTIYKGVVNPSDDLDIQKTEQQNNETSNEPKEKVEKVSPKKEL
ncbi:hypothetical protein FBALC1_07198 [Flavobacteriales bacterium ALC-1]|nr:hypothetical protein FBALC1_07198 [Flavobacteriales bacterium ALC-1]